MNQRFVRFLIPSISSGLCVPSLFFLWDLMCLGCLNQAYFQTLSAFALSLLVKKRFPPTLLFCALLLILFSSITHGPGSTYLAFLAGFFCLAKSVSYYSTHRYAIATLTTLLITLIPLIHTPTLSRFGLLCTIAGCTGNLLVVYFSLKWSPAVKKGNRL